VQVGQTLAWDNAAGKFREEEANALIRPYYNAPWKFPEY
jgi:hypothetical protein